MYSRGQGNAMRLLFNILLEEMERMGLRERMSEVPKSAREPKKFHSLQAPGFTKMCRPEWLNMNKAERVQVLNRWLFTKFSTDRSGEEMVPPPCEWPKQAEISWNTVWLFAAERDTLTTRVITRYTEAEAEVLTNAHGFDQ